MTEPPHVRESMDASTRALRDARLAWILGGSLLVAYAVLILLGGALAPVLPAGTFSVVDALWAAALVVFAFGIRGSGSVVARRPAGLVALLAAAVMPFVVAIAGAMLTPTSNEASYDNSLAVTINQSLQALWLAALVVACVVIARAGVVPRRWRWVPLIALIVAAAPQVIAAIAMVSISDPFAQVGVAMALLGVSSLGTLAVLVLGIFAIVLAPRETPRSTDPVQVYPPA